MNIDNRIELIMKKMDRLKEKSPKFACGKFPPEWKPPLSEQVIETYEKQNGIQLPEDYRRILDRVENLTFPLYRPSFLFYLVCTPCTPMLPSVQGKTGI